MNYAKYFLVIILVILSASFSLAKKYSDVPSGQGVSAIDTTGAGDYLSLYDCAQDFNTTANTGSWTVTIMNDLIEPNDAVFGNWVLDESTVTFKPAVPLTITFTTTSGPSAASGILGNWIIGSQTQETTLYGALDSTAIATNNFFIDGSTTGGIDRSLTIINIPTWSSYTAPGANGSQPVNITVYGACTNVQIKNCNIINASVNCPANIPYINILLMSRQATTPLKYYPSATPCLASNGIVIDNCYCLTTGAYYSATANNGYGICLAPDNHAGFYRPGSYGAMTTEPTNTIIKNCLIDARSRAINVVHQDNLTITNNTIRVHQSNPSAANPYGIFVHEVATTGSILTISNNILDQYVECLNGGYVVIDVTANATGTYTAPAGDFRVYNNMITGFSQLSSTSAPTRILPITAGLDQYGSNNAVTGAKYTILYNSINIDTVVTASMTAPACTGIVLGNTSVATTNLWTVKNNIVRVMQPGGIAVKLGTASGSTTASGATSIDNNDWYSSGANIAQLNTTNYATIAAWTTAMATGADVNSRSVNPMVTTPGAWVSAANLHFTGGVATGLELATQNLAPSPISVTTDIDGQTRQIANGWPGADDPQVPLPVELSKFKLD